MRTIEVLDRTTIDKIAAGEVVERPASVVKELVENAIDADSTAITVEIRDGGCSLIRITDNGCGIPADQVKKAFFRHATSKIRKVEDLTLIASLGFRGEALSSISAVAQVELITKTPEAMTGIRYCIDGGVEKDFEEVGAPSGSTFLIRNLFFNVPARAKFLKSAMTEGNHVTAVVEQLALSHPNISFKYIQNGQSKLYTSGNGNLQEIIYQVFGRDIAKELIPFHSESDTMTIDGFIGKPVIARGNRNFENYFVNGRYVKSKLIAKAIEDGYHGFMMQHRYPFTLLYFDINGEKVDVNVHPSKMELRFSDQEGLYHQVCQAIKNALMHKERIPGVTLGRDEKKPSREMPRSVSTPVQTGSRDVPKSEVNPTQTSTQSIPKSDGAPMQTAKVRPILPPEPFEEKRRSVEVASPDSGSRKVSGVASPDLNLRKTFEVSSVPMRREEAVKEKSDSNKTFDTASRPSFIKETTEKEYTRASDSTPVSTQTTTPDLSSVNPEEPALVDNASADSSIAPAAASADCIAAPSQSFESTEPATPDPTPSGEQLQLFDDILLSQKARSRHKIIGQIFDTYWLVEFDNSLYIIDQHAAHEKILYERMVKNYENRTITSQMVSPPAVVSLSSAEAVLLEKYMDVFASMGYEVEHFGGKEYKICAVPAELYNTNAEQLFRDIMDQLEQYGDHKPEAISERLASMSCKAAVKGNNRLSRAEAEALIDELLTLENPYNCPHGRPTIVSMTKYELEKKFKRIL